MQQKSLALGGGRVEMRRMGLRRRGYGGRVRRCDGREDGHAPTDMGAVDCATVRRCDRRTVSR